MLFSDIPGNEKVKGQLIAAYARNHVAHAQLFSTQVGGAGLAMALAFATFLNCENKQENDACGSCASCHKNAKLIHPDVHFVYPVANFEKKEISTHYLPEWRSFVLSQPFSDEVKWAQHAGIENKQINIAREESRQVVQHLSLKPVEGGYKFMLIWLPEYMNSSSANAILKILEEPPAKTIFLLVTQEAENLLTTIRSRTQMVQILPFTDEEVANHLIKTKELSPDKARHIAQMVEGNMSQALSLSAELEDQRTLVVHDWLRLCYAMAVQELVPLADQFAQMNKTAQKALLNYGLSLMRDSLIALSGSDSLLKSSEEDKAFISRFKTVLSLEKIEAISKAMDQALYHSERNANAKILFLGLSLELSAIFKSA
ncbi:DNA polymerase III subunit delta [Cytophagales bacterium LB-30]|uniref:DNA polymerase III subunit delta n=1 Tax=Shiella aurantiaca TaxID=3058365 RepID=A0ABT8F240_9BACT|nr:DNA polymerase III subunit delta [Shiella aurantiaca]MDN4164518.1 DNA polymerase III subunit delta [Shiella aurantiaca]